MFSVDLTTRDRDGYVVVALCGELDMADAAGVATAFALVIAREPVIIVDLAGLEFIDCRGLAALVRGWKFARRAGGELRLAAPQRRVLRMLTLTHLTGVLPVHASVNEAAECSKRAVALAAGYPVPVAVP